MSQYGYVDGSDTQLVHFFAPPPAPSAGSAWFFNQSSALLGAVYESTLAGCNTTGASVVFTFNGSNIFVFGSVVDPGSSSPPVSVYSVDGGSPTTFTAPQTTGRQDVVQFFGSSNMPLTNHTLTINITNASPGAPYYLDYLQYNIDVLPLSSSVAPTSFASATASSSPPADSTTASASPSATTSAAAETKQTAPTGAIVGGVVGGLAVLFMLIGALYWRRNQRPSGEFRYGTKAHQDAAPAVVPYMTASSLSLHGRTPNPSPAPYMPRSGSSASGPSGEDAMSQVTSSGGTTSSPSEGNATAPSQSEGPRAPMTSTRRQRLTLSYMRPPSTEGGGFPYPDMEAFSDHGGGSEVLPAYSPGPS